MNTKTNNIDKQINELNKQINQLQEEKRKIEYEAGRKHPNDDVDRFLRGYYGERLMKEHKLSDVGVWEILGEDPNCDYAGTHVQPHIGYVEGTLEKALLYAVKQPNWYSWGSGGSVKPITEKLIVKL